MQRPAQKLGMVLTPDIVGVFRQGQLGHFHSRARLVAPDKFETRVVDLIDVFRVDFVPVAVSFRDLAAVVGASEGRRRVVDLLQGASRGAIRVRVGEFGHACTEAHGAAHVVLIDFGHENDDLFVGVFVEFGRVGVRPAQDVAGILHDLCLESEADAEVGFLVGAAVFGCQYFTEETTWVRNA